jgi:vacuolar-type H+-ATPase subunit I/STV1
MCGEVHIVHFDTQANVVTHDVTDIVNNVAVVEESDCDYMRPVRLKFHLVVQPWPHFVECMAIRFFFSHDNGPKF